MAASREIASNAYDRMAHGISEQAHPWQKNSEHEVLVILDFFNHLPEKSRFLDFGCGTGRHSVQLAKRGHIVTGIDFSGNFLKLARELVEANHVDITLEKADCRYFTSHTPFDAALCLYDVLGSFGSDDENRKILQSLVLNVTVGGYVAISVMNRRVTELYARNSGEVSKNPTLLNLLKPSNTMESTGHVFNPEYYVCDPTTGITYRREQFQAAGQLPLEVIVRDRRYYADELMAMGEDAGLETLALRPVAMGHWNTKLDETDKRAKELLYIGKRLR